MALYTNRTNIYNKLPLDSNGDREEDFLIEVLGNWIPESDIIFWGLLNSEFSENFYKLRSHTSFDQRSVYLNTCYFRADDLVRYLSSVDDTLDRDLTDEEVKMYVQVALNNYTFVPSNETMMRHSIIPVTSGAMTVQRKYRYARGTIGKYWVERKHPKYNRVIDRRK